MFTDVMLEYFRGERFEAFIVILPKGLAMIGFGAAMLILDRTAFV